VAVTKTQLAAVRDTANNDNIVVTLSRAITANKPCLAFYFAHSTAPSDASTASGGGVTWTKRATSVRGNIRVTVFSSDGVASPSGTSVTFTNVGATSPTANDAFVYEIDGSDSTPSGWRYNANNAASSTTVTATLGSAPAAGDYGLAAAGFLATGGISWDAGSEDSDSTHASPSCNTAVNSVSSSPPTSITATGSSANCVIGYVGIIVAASGNTVTPGVASLTTSTFAPVLQTKIDVPVKALTLTTFAPAIGLTVTPATASLTTTTFAPVKGLSVTPATASLATSTFAPQLQTTINAASPTALTLTTFAPVISQTVTPAAASLTLTTFAPSILVTDHKLVTPDTATLATTGYAPVLSTTLTPSTASLSLTAFAPSVLVSDNKLVTPDPASLTLTTFAPTITTSDAQTVIPDTASLTLTTFAPTVTATDHKLVTPDPASLSLTTFAPTVLTPQTVTPGTASLSLATFAPTVAVTNNVVVTPGTAHLALTSFAPRVLNPVTIQEDRFWLARFGRGA